MFWKVDLETQIYITSVTITARADEHWMQSDFFQILVQLISATWKCSDGFLPNKGETRTIVCSPPRKGDGIKILVPGSNKRLSLCEVEVHGRLLDFYDREGKKLFLNKDK